MIELFACFGLMLMCYAGIVCVGLFLRWLWSDDEFGMIWLFTSLFFAASLTAHIMQMLT